MGIIKTPTAGMSRQEWLKLRKTGIGGSDAGAVCGVNPYASPIHVYLDKTQEEARERDNEPMRQGRDLEDYVARRFAEATGLKVRRSRYLYRDPQYPFMLADVDRLIVGHDAGLECKTASPYQEDAWKDGAIPPHYRIQCLHYMAVTGKKEWYLAVVILGKGFQYRKLVWDDDLIRKLRIVEEAFWTRYVLPRKMPEPDGSMAFGEALGQHYPKAVSGSSIRLEGFDKRLERREVLLKEIKELEQEQRKIEQELKVYLKDRESAKSSRYQVTWMNVETARLDAVRLKEEQPEIYQQYVKVNHSRRLTVKVA